MTCRPPAPSFPSLPLETGSRLLPRRSAGFGSSLPAPPGLKRPPGHSPETTVPRAVASHRLTYRALSTRPTLPHPLPSSGPSTFHPPHPGSEMPPPRRTTLLGGLPTPTAVPSLPSSTHLSAPPPASSSSSPTTTSTGPTTTTTTGGGGGSSTPPLTSMQSMDAQFEPLDVIGTGSFGIIRKVRRKHDGLLLARKELNYGRMDERDLRQLGEEVNILQNLGSNEYIVRYHERYVDKQNFMLYILMECPYPLAPSPPFDIVLTRTCADCAQGDLAGLISRCRRDAIHLPEETVWSYLSQITSALADCHSAVPPSPSTPSSCLSPAGEDAAAKARERGVILHRDIKPENVFLDHDGIVKLGDFGLSKAMELAAFTNTYVGTPYYMSPELINGQQYDVKSDIWALGCLIYELCAWQSVSPSPPASLGILADEVFWQPPVSSGPNPAGTRQADPRRQDPQLAQGLLVPLDRVDQVDAETRRASALFVASIRVDADEK